MSKLDLDSAIGLFSGSRNILSRLVELEVIGNYYQEDSDLLDSLNEFATSFGSSLSSLRSLVIQIRSFYNSSCTFDLEGF